MRGDPFLLIRELRRTGADKLVVDHIDRSKLYLGSLAGAMAVSKDVECARLMALQKKVKDKAALLGGDFSGLGLVDFFVAPFNNVTFCGALEASAMAKERGTRQDIILLGSGEVVTVLGSRHKMISNKGQK